MDRGSGDRDRVLAPSSINADKRSFAASVDLSAVDQEWLELLGLRWHVDQDQDTITTRTGIDLEKVRGWVQPLADELAVPPNKAGSRGNGFNAPNDLAVWCVLGSHPNDDDPALLSVREASNCHCE